MIGAAPEQLEYERAHPHAASALTLDRSRGAHANAVVHIPDVLADPEYEWAAHSPRAYRAMLGVPILVETS